MDGVKFCVILSPMALKYWAGGHTKHRALWHVVWIPKYRRRVLIGKIASRVIGLVYEAAKMNRWWIEEIKVMKDHVHMLVQVQSTDSIAEVINIIKGGTSRVIRKEFPELEEFLWGDSFWADGYFAETVGRRNFQEVKNYIKENQESMTQDSETHGL